MATLTSRLNISGIVGTRRISFEHTYTMEDVYDAVLRASSNPFNFDYYAGQTDNVLYLQDTPNYVFLHNSSLQVPVVFKFGVGATNTPMVVCTPGAICITHGAVTLNTSSGTTSLGDVTNIAATGVTGLSNGKPATLLAFNAAT
jgi:hypothetical protein